MESSPDGLSCGPSPTEESDVLYPFDSIVGRPSHCKPVPRCHQQESRLPRYPKYPRQVRLLEHHGDTREDPYYWLRDSSHPLVKKLLKQENEVAEAFFSAQREPALRRTLFQELRGRWKEDDVSLPFQDRHYWYYTRQVKHAEYPLYCRRPFSLERGVNVNFMEELAAQERASPMSPLPVYDDEVVFLDVNLLVQELRLDGVEIGDVEVSPDEELVAVMLDCSNGKEIFTLFVLPIEDVNYAHWLRTAANGTQRTWAAQQAKDGHSIYTVSGFPCLRGLRSPASLRGSPVMHKSNSRHFFPLRPPQARTEHVHFPTGSPQTVLPIPRHSILHRIEMFDMSSEVLWLTNTSVVYTALDEKLRPYQLVYHDLTRGDDDPNASIVCYEEDDEAFWVSCPSFSTDELYLMFCTASTEISEWYIAPVPHDHQEMDKELSPSKGKEVLIKEGHRQFNGIPLVPSAIADSYETEVALHEPATPAILTCFSPRVAHPAREYDIDHHDALLGPDEGAWLITSNACSCTNGAIYFVPDVDGTDDFNVPWELLFTYDATFKVEGIELAKTYLLIDVRREGLPTVLFCPIAILWEWWTNNRGKASGCRSPLELLDLMDMASIIPTPHTPNNVTSLDKKNVLSGSQSAADRWEVQKWKVCRWGGRVRPVLCGDGARPTVNEASDLGEEICRPVSMQLNIIECCSCSSSFSANTWSVTVSHLIHPTVQFEIQFTCERVDTGAGGGTPCEAATIGSLAVRLMREEVVNGMKAYDPSEYEASIAMVPSAYTFTQLPQPPASPLPTKVPAEDVDIPVFLCWKKSLYRKGLNPMVVHVYGSYGDCCDPEFSAERLSLLDRGFVWAMAAVRGGGDLGIPWRDAGRRLQRATAVNDFVSVCSYLQNMHVCAPGRLISCGSSAGGFVVTRAMTLAPQLFFAVIAKVPFVDCLTSLLDDKMPLTITEWDEYGNPLHDAEAYHYIKALSPMDNIPSDAETIFPHVFLETSWDDTRVGYWESLAFTARLRERWRMASASAGRVLLHCCEFGAGHMGASGRYQQLREIAREYAFILCIVAVETEKDGSVPHSFAEAVKICSTPSYQ